MAIVQTNINYTHEIMMSNLHELNNTYPFIQIQNVGFSVLGKSIPVIKLGHGRNQVFYSASIHAQEWITSVLLMKFIEDYCLIYSNSVIRPNTLIGSMSRIGSNCTVTFNTKVKAGSDIEDGCVIKLKDEYDFEVGI